MVDEPTGRRVPGFSNPVTGEHSLVLTDPRERADEALVAELTVAPGGRVAAPHLHPTVRERFLILDGQIAFLRDGEEAVLGPGEGAVIEPGVVHDWWQVGPDPARAVVEVVPGVRFTEMVGSLFGLAREGKVNPEGLPDPLQLIVMAHEYRETIAFTSPPALVQRVLFPPLAIVGRLVGKRPSYERFTRTEEMFDADPRALAALTPDGRLREF
ncbi:cupin domain-containing protein [Thermoleophilia bacterium SCSIO 60948]|nr:cupin domain-containing protein [Thermoleophilia bacterium SCSIO 60948]